MSHHHCHETEHLSDTKLLFAILLNLLLSVAEVIGGILSGSLALIADALHNLQDCGSLVIALVARRVARRPADRARTFGYRRAEVIGALINLTGLIVVGLFLVYEAIERWIEPREIAGEWVIVFASVALAVDVFTALLLISMSRGNLNLRAAFLHNVADALGSVGVIAVGVAIVLWDYYFLDVLVTLAIAGYILWQSLAMIRQSIHILMESVPGDLDIESMIEDMSAITHVLDVHHLHIWQLDEHHSALEAHVVVDLVEPESQAIVKQQIKELLRSRYDIGHTTLEFEFEHESSVEDCNHCEIPARQNH